MSNFRGLMLLLISALYVLESNAQINANLVSGSASYWEDIPHLSGNNDLSGQLLNIKFIDPEPVENVKVKIRIAHVKELETYSNSAGEVRYRIEAGSRYEIIATKLGYADVDTFLPAVSQLGSDPIIFVVFLDKKYDPFFEGFLISKGEPLTDPPLIAGKTPLKNVEIITVAEEPEAMIVKAGDIVEISEKITEDVVNEVIKDRFFAEAKLGSGVSFAVQIAAAASPMLEGSFKNISSVYVHQSEMYRYFSGVFRDYKSAVSDLNKSKKLIRKDSFISAYKDGERIPLGVALKLL